MLPCHATYAQCFFSAKPQRPRPFNSHSSFKTGRFSDSFRLGSLSPPPAPGQLCNGMCREEHRCYYRTIYSMCSVTTLPSIECRCNALCRSTTQCPRHIAAADTWILTSTRSLFVFLVSAPLILLDSLASSFPKHVPVGCRRLLVCELAIRGSRTLQVYPNIVTEPQSVQLSVCSLLSNPNPNIKSSCPILHPQREEKRREEEPAEP
ncbi:hypothetical protein BGZ63DRAFT_375855 [Mariannaea sp. PMI_226]|nr:hypothetical protein BGZ63DRAFT_375855 [Mariannaea sp. PMI_226]